MKEDMVMVWINEAVVILLTVLMWVIPDISRSTTPLGVRVPREHINESVIRLAITRYRTIGGLSTTAVLVGMALTRDLSMLNAVWILAVVVLWCAAFAISRPTIVRAKRENRWYDGKTVRISATVTDDRHAFTPFAVPHILSMAMVVASGIALVIHYPYLPDHYPTHWNSNGKVDGWETKSWFVVSALPIIAFLIVLLLTVMAWIIARKPEPHLPDGDASESQRRDNDIRLIINITMATLNLTLAAMMSLLVLAPLIDASKITIPLAICAIALVVIFIACTAATVRVRATDHNDRANSAESPDDDDAWKLGLFYINRDNPSVLVPKRSGIGLTINLGNPIGILIMIGSLALFIAAIALPILFQS